jgi:hypothetical protein
MHFGIVHDPLLTPLYSYVAVLNSLIAYERQAGASTFAIKGAVDIEDQASVTFDDVVSGDSALPAGAAAVAGPLSALLASDLGKARITGITLDVDARETTSTATIERVWIDASRPRAGDTVDVHVQMRHFRGATETVTIPIEVPAYARGRMTLRVTDGTALAEWERRDGRAETPGTIPDLVRALNRTPRANRIYVRLIAAGAGAIVNGEAMGSLPPSVQAVFTDNRAGNATALDQAVLGSWDRRLDVTIQGARELTFSLDPSR